MNNSLFGLGMQPTTNELVGVILPDTYALTTSAIRSWVNPFNGPALVQPILKWTSAGAGQVAGDIIYCEGQFTANGGYDGSGFFVIDCSTNIKIQVGNVHNIYSVTGGVATDITAAAYVGVGVSVVGRRNDLLRGWHAPGLKKTALRPIPFTLATAYKLDNPLGRQPKLFTLTLLNRVSEAGYSPGDMVAFGSHGGQTLSSANYCSTYQATPGKLYIYIANQPTIIHKTTGAETNMTSGKWDFIVKLIG